jgi:hypothetical protein
MRIGEEIRLNNFLREKATRKAFRVTKAEAVTMPDGKIHYVINGMDEKDVEGIPLDDDVLLLNCHLNVKWNISCIALAVLLKGVDKFYMEEKFILIKEKGEYFLFLSSFSTESQHGVERKKIDYLHQLQNFYQIIARENLTVDMQ